MVNPDPKRVSKGSRNNTQRSEREEEQRLLCYRKGPEVSECPLARESVAWLLGN